VSAATDHLASMSCFSNGSTSIKLSQENGGFRLLRICGPQGEIDAAACRQGGLHHRCR
jgi:hypothetical protein